MRTLSSSNLIVDPITIPKRRNRRRSKQIVELEFRTIVETPVTTMADAHTMLELLQAPTEGYGDAIVIPAILADNFELKVGLLQLVTSSQFHGFERDDPHAHIRWFNKITSTLKYQNVSNEVIKLMPFLFSLDGAARIWLEKEPPRSILTWVDFTTNLKNDITNFQQRFDESFVKMSRDVLTVGSTMRIPLLYRGEYSQWSERFMNYLEEQTDGKAMIYSIKNGDQPLPRVTQVSIVETSSTEQPPLKDKSLWSDQEKKIQKIDRLARSLLIEGLPNDIYPFIDSNKTAKDLWDALVRHMLGSEYGEQDRKAAVSYEYETFKATEEELLLDTYIRYLQYATMMRQNKNLLDINIDALYNILKKNQSDVNDAMKYKKKAVVITSDPLALVADERKKFYSKPTNNKLRTSSANMKQEYVKSDDKKKENKVDEKKET
nr:reverse transcriptase domain-containing protein [Tanacetum cinerariifolium]